MKKQHAFVIVLLWAALTAFAWFSPDKAMSDSERRPLAQFPEVSVKTLLDGSFMEKFESFLWTSSPCGILSVP